MILELDFILSQYVLDCQHGAHANTYADLVSEPPMQEKTLTESYTKRFTDLFSYATSV